MNDYNTSWIKQAAAEHFGVSEKALETGGSQRATAVRVRAVAVYVAREIFPHLSTTDLGEAFGCNASTAFERLHKIQSQLDAGDERLRADVESVKRAALERMPEDKRPPQKRRRS